MDLRGVNLTAANLRLADLTGADLRYATLIQADLSNAVVMRTDFRHANLTDCDLTGVYGRGVNFAHARCWTSHMRYAQFKNAIFCYADLTGVDFLCSLLLGAKFDEAKLDGIRNAETAIYTWWYAPFQGGPRKISVKPVPGYIRMDESVTGDFSIRENSARERVEEEVVKGWDHKL